MDTRKLVSLIGNHKKGSGDDKDLTNKDICKIDHKHCDTDLFLLSKISYNDRTIDYDLLKHILHQTLQKAVVYKDFDFEIATLRLYKKNYLLFHSHVFGGAQKTGERIKYLVEAEKIAIKTLKKEIESEGLLLSEPVKKAYIFYSQDINELKENISFINPNLNFREIDDNTVMYFGSELVIATTDIRDNKHSSLDFLSFKIIERIVDHDEISSDLLVNITENIIDKYLSAGPILYVRNDKKPLKDFYISTISQLIAIFVLVAFVYSQPYILENIISAIGASLIFISVVGMTIFTIKNKQTQEDVIFK